MRKGILALLALILMFSVFGCSQNASSDSKGNTDPSTLVLWVFADTHKRFFEAARDEFLKTHPDAKVDIQLLEYGAMYDKYTVIAKSKGKGAPDLIDMEQGAMPRFIRGDVPFEPLNTYLKQDNLQDAIAAGRQALYTIDGKVYGLEHAACASLLYYRKDLFDQAGIDVATLKTWDEFTEAAKKLTGKDKYIFPAGDTTGNELGQFEQLLRQEGGDIVTKDGNIGINTPEGIAVLKRIHNWKELGIMEKTQPEGPAFWEAFKEGRYIAAYGPDWWAGALVDQTVDALNGKWAAVPMPLGGPNSVPTTVVGGTGLAISKFSNNKDLAWEFLKTAQLTKDMAVKRYELTNLFPPLLAAFDDPRLHEKNKFTEFFSGQDMGELYANVIKDAPNQNQAWWRPLVGQAWEAYRYDYEEGKMKPEEFLDKVEEELKKLIATEEKKQQ